MEDSGPEAMASVGPVLLESSTEDPDALLAVELNRLSMQEREQVLYEVHGVAEAIDEQPDFVNTCLSKFDTELDKIQGKAAYEQALLLDPRYVRNLNFRLQLLRASRFDAAEAAVRMVRFFQCKLELFGTDKLVKDIRIADLNSEDVACLESGFLQLLPMRDRSGRAIIFMNPQLRGNANKESRLRAIYYISMSCAEDIDTQKRGVVFVFYKTGPNQTFDDQAGRANIRIISSLPGIMAVALHFCFDNPKFNPVLSLFLKTMDSFQKNMVVRVKMHHVLGTHVEVQDRLLSFGIPMKVFPVTSEGETKVERHLEWIQQRRKREESDQDSKRIIIPGAFDVIMGRDRLAQEHTGNVHYLDMIETHLVEYDALSKPKKTELASRIVDGMHESGGRFLKCDGTGWIEIDDKTARYKVSMAFRSKRRTVQTPTKTQRPRRGIEEVFTAASVDSGESSANVELNENVALSGFKRRKFDTLADHTSSNVS